MTRSTPPLPSVSQRLAELGRRERSSASRREFSMAITAWSAKVATACFVLVERPHLLAEDRQHADDLILAQHGNGPSQ